MMREKWQNLTQRDRRILIIGSVVVIVMLVYTYAWNPLSTAVSEQYNDLRRGQSLLVWMKHAMQRLDRYEALGYQLPSPTKQKLDEVVKAQFKAQRIAYHITSIKLLDKTSVGVNFGQVPFDRLITALTQMADKQGIVVKSTRITRKSTDGLVDAKMILEKIKV
ncbi:MAG: type II secretion system protein GspM [Coxiellaceae bacterium]|nr:type II secretion system protein GspM [Coxiellaceae bacterium]